MRTNILNILLALASIAVGIIAIIKEEYTLSLLIVILIILNVIVLSYKQDTLDEYEDRIKKLEEQMQIYKDLAELKAKIK